MSEFFLMSDGSWNRPAIFMTLAVLVALVRYGTYLLSIYRRQTTPHVFSWLNWGLVTGIGAVAQFRLEGGLSAYVLTLVAGTCLFIAVIALFVGEKDITRSDKMAFAGALLAIPAWVITENPFAAIVLLILIDGLAYYPTVRKSWRKPWSEPALSYFWAGLRYGFALLAIETMTYENIVYPFFLMATDWAFALMLVGRRMSLRRSAAAAMS